MSYWGWVREAYLQRFWVQLRLQLSFLAWIRSYRRG
jgi:hypothetical protein